MSSSFDPNQNYDYESLRDEREFGFYWYDILWKIARPLIIFVGAIVIIVGLSSMGINAVNNNFLDAVDPLDARIVEFEIESGDSLTRVSNNLEKIGLIKNRSAFKYYCDFAGLGQKIQAGDYELNKQMNMFEVAQLLTTGDGQPTVTDITIVPGMTVETIAKYLVEKDIFKSENEFLEICKTAKGVSDYYFLKDVLNSPDLAQRKYALEGYLAPNTYEVYYSSEPRDIAKKLLSQTDKVYNVEYQSRATELGYTMDDIVNIAALIEKEAKKNDFAKVSAIFHNRLKMGMPLQSDVTIHYVTGERRMALRKSDLQVQSPYNTYLHKGLPVGPICNPSPEAIYAALYPDEGYVIEKYLYFCSKNPDTGELYFSKTLDEHERAVDIYAPLWEAYDKERGM